MLATVSVVLGFCSACSTQLGRDTEANARIVVSVRPTAGLVLVDEVPRARVPAGGRQAFVVEPGFRRIEVEAKGFRTYRTEATLRSGEVLDLDVELWPRVPELE